MVTRLEDLVVYQTAMEIGDEIYNIISRWPIFDRDTLGKQIVRSADSIALNIAEGFGRFHYKENKNFCFFARGSLFETKSALFKAKNRNLVEEERYNPLYLKLERFSKILNSYIKSIGSGDK